MMARTELNPTTFEFESNLWPSVAPCQPARPRHQRSPPRLWRRVYAARTGCNV